VIANSRVTVVSQVTSEESASKSLPVLVAACNGLVDELIIVVPKADKILTGVVWGLLLDASCDARVVAFSDHASKMYIPAIFGIPELENAEIIVWCSEDLCYIHPDAICNLVSHIASRKELSFAYPACVGTERTTYMQQAMGFLPPWCFKMWDGLYIDYLDIRKEHPNLQEACHRAWLSELNQGRESLQQFGVIRLEEKDIPVECCFAFDNRKRHELFKPSDRSAKVALMRHITKTEICGRAWTAYYAYPEHVKHMDRTDIWTQYLSHIQQSSDAVAKVVEDEIQYGSGSSLLNSMVGECAKSPSLEDLRFCISTHVSDMHRSVPVITNSLFRNGIKPDQIHIVSGGFDSPQTLEINRVKINCVTHNSYDHTALIDVVENNVPGWWWFVMHATAEVGPRFVERILEKGLDCEHIAVLEYGWLNMGLMSRSFIEKNSNYILNLKNCSKMQAILTEQMYWRMAETRDYYNEVNPKIYAGSRDVYQDGIQRQILYLDGCDLYKYQAYHIIQERTQRLLSENIVQSSDLIPKTKNNQQQYETNKK
jgi:hypothetical protein